MAIRKVHHDTAAIARRFAREKLGVAQPKLRAPDRKESVDAALNARLNINQVRDTVVVRDKKTGDEYLLNIDLDPQRSRELNVESAILTASGLVPLIGAPVVAAFAIKDLVKSTSKMAASRAKGEVADPADRALYRMGLRHLGLAGLSTVTQGAALAVSAASDIAEVATGTAAAAEAVMATEQGQTLISTAKGVKSGIVGAEAALTGQDTVNSTNFEKPRFRPFKAIAAGLQGIAGVHEHHQRTHEDARIVVVRKTAADGTVEKNPEIAPPRRPEGANAPTGPPPG